MLGMVGLLSARHSDAHMPWWSFLATIGTLFGSMFLALFIFNRRGFRPNLMRKSRQERITDLDQAGRLVRQAFRAMRAFSIQEFEDEGPTYCIELDDGKVLVLSGQYLHDFEPITDDPEVNQSRRFPCTEFEVLRHKDAGYVLDINCAGIVLEPEVVARAYTEAELRGGVPEDGEVIADRTYDALKRERTDG